MPRETITHSSTEVGQVECGECKPADSTQLDGTHDVTGHRNCGRFGRAVHKIVFFSLHFGQHTAIIIKLGPKKCAGHVARMGIIKKMHTRFQSQTVNGDTSLTF